MKIIWRETKRGGGKGKVAEGWEGGKKGKRERRGEEERKID